MLLHLSLCLCAIVSERQVDTHVYISKDYFIGKGTIYANIVHQTKNIPAIDVYFLIHYQKLHVQICTDFVLCQSFAHQLLLSKARGQYRLLIYFSFLKIIMSLYPRIFLRLKSWICWNRSYKYGQGSMYYKLNGHFKHGTDI